jgi:hypothetical protein
VHFGENVHVAKIAQRITVSVGERAVFKTVLRGRP